MEINKRRGEETARKSWESVLSLKTIRFEEGGDAANASGMTGIAQFKME